MRKHLEKILRLTCFALGALLIFQVARAIIRGNPLAKVTIPEVPTLPVETNAVASSKDTHPPATKTGTNVHSVAHTNFPATNQLAVSTNAPAVNLVSSNLATNAVSVSDSAVSVTNTVEASATNGTALGNATNSTNTVAGHSHPDSKTNKTNASPSIVAKHSPGSRPNFPSPGRAGMRGGKPLPELPFDIQARVDRIYESELFGQVMHPMPAGLMGIAGNMAFLRSSSGQTGLVKEGDSLGEMKLLRIGINRVLVEENGEQKELMIFNGYGGESLLSKKETPDETIHK